MRGWREGAVKIGGVAQKAAYSFKDSAVKINVDGILRRLSPATELKRI